MSAHVCTKCNYNTISTYNWNKHILTQKHLRERKVISCLNCDQTFEYQSIFKRHKSTCNKKIEGDEKKTRDKMAADMICQLVEQNKELRELLMSQTDQIENIVKNAEKQITDKIEKQLQLVIAKPTRSRKQPNAINNGTVNNGIINNNQKFNINVFLNVKCKDALNLSDFIESIKVEVEDVERLGELGFAAGISHIIIGALENLDLYKRPIHCKKKTMYVKEEDKWSEDEKRQQIMRLVRNVSQKNLRVLCSKLMGPERMDTESPDYDKQVALIRQVNGGRHRDSSEHDIVKQIDEFVQLYEQALMDADFTREELDEMERRICGAESLV
jgi:hypothetical protein